jgi:hypothetical protein
MVGRLHGFISRAVLSAPYPVRIGGKSASIGLSGGFLPADLGLLAQPEGHYYTRSKAKMSTIYL